MATPPPVNLRVILSESKRIINAHSRHFLALSVLFLLPVCFSATVFPSVLRILTDQSPGHDTVSLLRGGRDYQPRAAGYVTVVLLWIAYTAVATVFNLLAVGSITYSVFQGFYGRPVKLLSAVKSGLTSFFALLGTLISMKIIIFGILAVLGFAAFLLIRVFESTGLKIDFASPYFLAICLIWAIASIVIVFKLNVNWILYPAIVVVESKWGFTPLKRSKSLVNGMRGVSLSIILFFALTESVLAWSSSVASTALLGGDGDTDDKTWWTNAYFVLMIVITSAFLTLLSLYSMAAITVMYMYCKAVQGELAWEIAEEFAREYVSLPFDDHKVPHLVSVAYNV